VPLYLSQLDVDVLEGEQLIGHDKSHKSPYVDGDAQVMQV
jgi:hypothetical protein